MPTIFLDTFEQEPVNKLDVAGLANWNIISGSVDVIGAGNLCPGACLDMDGTNIAKGPLVLESKHTFSLTPGWYELFFDVAGSQRQFRFDIGGINSITASVGGDSSTVSMTSLEPWRTESILFQPVGAIKIRLESLESPDYVGLLFDNIGLRTAVGPVDPPTPTPVPEPEGLSLLGIALVAVVIMRRYGWLVR